jgi:hypothetical protein
VARWAIYGDPDSVPLKAWSQGLDRVGASYFWRDHSWWSGEAETADAIAIYGMRAQGRDIVDHYARRGVPIIVLDHGYMKRVNRVQDYERGYFQVSLGKLGWLPNEAPSDRFAELGIEIKTRAPRPIRRAVICGQVPFDASHRLPADGLARLYEALAAQLRQAGVRRVTFRPHPMGEGRQVKPDIEPDGEWTLAESIAGADLIASINSNSGLDAILAGCPAVTLRPSHYGALAYRWPVRLGAIAAPEPARITAHLERLAYAQWTADEIRQGQPHQFLQSIGAIP